MTIPQYERHLKELAGYPRGRFYRRRESLAGLITGFAILCFNPTSRFRGLANNLITVEQYVNLLGAQGGHPEFAENTVFD